LYIACNGIAECYAFLSVQPTKGARNATGKEGQSGDQDAKALGSPPPLAKRLEPVRFRLNLASSDQPSRPLSI
jgi:hypothetical protein